MEVLQLAWSFLCFLIAILFLAFGLYCTYIKIIHWRYDHIPGAPRASFFLGHVPLIWGSLKKKEVPHNIFLKWAEEYGPVLRFNAFHRVHIIVVTPEAVKEYLMLPNYPKDQTIYARFSKLFGTRFLGNGLVTDLNYDHWHKQRKMMDPAFSRMYLIGLVGTFNDQAEELMKELQKKADGETKVDVLNFMRRVTLDIIGKVAFGLELNTLHDDQAPFPHAVNMLVRGLGEGHDPFFQYKPGNRKVVQEVQESLRLLRRTGKECIEKRRKDIEDKKEIPTDILTQILKTAGQKGYTDEESILDNFVTFFFAGHETTANQLSFTIMELGRQPEIVAKLQAEVDEAIGEKADIAFEDLEKLEYLSQVLKEALRLYPPCAGTVRWTGKENVIEGVKIPANSTLIFSTYMMGRMERYFKDAQTFNPDRFSKDQPKPYFCYFPFSLGPRICIGQIFAQMEAKVIMAKFLQRFEFELVPPQNFKIIDTGTLRPADGVVCRLKPRCH